MLNKLIYRLNNPPFMTETSERNLMAQAAAELERCRGMLEDARGIVEQIEPDFKFYVADDSKQRRIERARRWLETADALLDAATGGDDA